MSGRRERALERLQRRRLTILYRVVGRILTTGLWFSIGFLAIGFLLAILQREPLSEELTPLRDIPSAIVDIEPGGFIDLGLVALLLTPAAAVVATLTAALRQRDWPFVGVGIMLVVIILLSLITGLI